MGLALVNIKRYLTESEFVQNPLQSTKDKKGKFIRPPNTQPSMFLYGRMAGRKVLREVEKVLKSDLHSTMSHDDQVAFVEDVIWKIIDEAPAICKEDEHTLMLQEACARLMFIIYYGNEKMFETPNPIQEVKKK